MSKIYTRKFHQPPTSTLNVELSDMHKIFLILNVPVHISHLANFVRDQRIPWRSTVQVVREILFQEPLSVK
jgi:hypothetical protein